MNWEISTRVEWFFIRLFFIANATGLKRVTWPKDKMSSLLLLSWVEFPLQSQQLSRTTASLQYRAVGLRDLTKWGKE